MNENRNIKIGTQKVPSKNDYRDIDKERLVLKLSESLIEIKQLNSEIENLRIALNSKKNNQLKVGIIGGGTSSKDSRTQAELKREIYDLKHSVSFELGQLFVYAISKPGKNTILLPYYVAKMAASYFFQKKVNFTNS